MIYSANMRSVKLMNHFNNFRFQQHTFENSLDILLFAYGKIDVQVSHTSHEEEEKDRSQHEWLCKHENRVEIIVNLHKKRWEKPRLTVIVQYTKIRKQWTSILAAERNAKMLSTIIFRAELCYTLSGINLLRGTCRRDLPMCKIGPTKGITPTKPHHDERMNSYDHWAGIIVN